MSNLAAFNAAAERLWAQLVGAWPGLELEIVARTESTNSRLLDRARLGLSGPCVLVALEQTSGRGRMGRQWMARPGADLTFSISLPWPAAGDGLSKLSGLSLAIGVATAEALHAEVKVKWPNDLCLLASAEGAIAGSGDGVLFKLGGILIETALAGPQNKALVIGVGVNIAAPSPSERSFAPPGAVASNASPVDAPAIAPLPRAGHEQLCPGSQPAQVLEALVPAILSAVSEFSTHGFSPFVARFAARDALKGHVVRFSSAAMDGQGMALGVDDRGRLLVHTSSGVQAISSGEISVRLD